MKKKLKIILPIIVILLVISIGVGLFFIYSNNEMDSADASKIATEEDNEIVDKLIDLEQNNIAGTYSDINIMDAETAKKSIENVKDKIGINSIEEEIQATVSNTNGEYINTYKFQQMYKGIEVYSGELIVYTDKQGKAEGIINKYNKIPSDFNVNPVNTDEELQEIVLNTVNKENAQIKNSKLIIYYLGNQEYILAHEYTIEANQEENEIREKRAKFYERLGFHKLDTNLKWFNSLFLSVYYLKLNDNLIYDEEEILNNIFEIYYNVHGRKKVNENCEIIK